MGREAGLAAWPAGHRAIGPCVARPVPGGGPARENWLGRRALAVETSHDHLVVCRLLLLGVHLELLDVSPRGRSVWTLHSTERSTTTPDLRPLELESRLFVHVRGQVHPGGHRRS